MTTATLNRAPPLVERRPDGRIRLNFHGGQRRAWKSRRRFIAVLAGAQSGKTAYSPWWLWREIKLRGPGDYLAVTATYDLFKLKMLPALREVFEDTLHRARYWSGDRVLELADPSGYFRARRAGDAMWGRIILRSAESGSGLESSTALAAILDEAGMDSFRIESWEAVQRRLALARGRALLTTTLYNFGWLKTEVHDRWLAGDPDYDVIRFDSTENPAFPPEEFARARATMPEWRFNLQYRGIFVRPAGLIYDSFRDEPYPRGHVIPRREFPPDWPRFLGLDFGGVNTAGVFLAQDPVSKVYHAYREYHAGERTAAEHARALLAGEPVPVAAIGGSPSEGQWRQEFDAAKLLVLPPAVSDVEVGINRVYAAFKEDQLLICDHLHGLLRELRSYSRVLDASGQPTEKIEDKASFHRLDAARYLIGWLRAVRPTATPSVAGPGYQLNGYLGPPRPRR